jgi:hypothetical protein
MVYVKLLPTITGSGESAFVIERSAGGGRTEVEAEAVLLELFGSASLPVTDAVLVSVPVTVGVTTTVAVATAPLFRLPKLQITVPADWEQLP